MSKRLQEFVARRWAVPQDCVNVETAPLCGGLESAVTLARLAPVEGASIPGTLVMKELRPGCGREADIYQLLWQHVERPPSPVVFGVESDGDVRYLYLEHVPSLSAWPWVDARLSAAVCRELARLHDSTTLPTQAFAWDYEAQLSHSAESTLDLALSARDATGTRCWRRVGDLRRVVAALPDMRARLCASRVTVIHGDVHPGNVIARTGHPDTDVALIDWSRARLGSPLEDVASWLHSVGCWEPEARRRHDSLMRTYLESRRDDLSFNTALRVEYWLASASNGLSGAIRYHLAVVADPAAAEPARLDSSRALAAWERVIRRAAGLLSTSQARCS